MKDKCSMTPTNPSIAKNATLKAMSIIKVSEDIRHSVAGDNEGVADLLLNKELDGSGH